jgi:hypothetical protein
VINLSAVWGVWSFGGSPGLLPPASTLNGSDDTQMVDADTLSGKYRAASTTNRHNTTKRRRRRMNTPPASEASVPM